MAEFAGFQRTDIRGIPVLWRSDGRFKTLRCTAYLQRPLDRRAASRFMLPALLLQGTESDLDRPALMRRMQALFGAAVHPSSGKAGESHVLSLTVDTVSGACLPGRPDQLGEGLSLLSDLILRPRLERGGFPADVFAREQRQTANAIRTLRDDKGEYAMERAIECACEGEPMAIPEHGSLADVERMTPHQPEDARQDFLAHGRMWVVAMGDLPDAATLKAKIDSFLGQFPPRAVEPVPDPVVVERREPRRTVEHSELRQSKLVMVFRAPVVDDPRVRAGRNLFLSMFGGGPNSRLFVEVREKRSLAYYASASFDRHKSLMIVSVGLDGSAAPEAEAAVLEQLAEVQAGRCEPRELETARHMLLSSLRSVDDSIAARVRFTNDQWMSGTDRSPDQVAELCARATMADVVDGGAGIWLDHSYLLTDSPEAAS